MFKNYLVVVFMLVLSTSLSAQVSGYLGKQFILRTNVADYLAYEKGVNVQAEYVFARRASVYLGIHTKEDSYEDFLISGFSGNRRNVGPALVNSWETEIGIRTYFNKAIPGPSEWYFYLQGAIGEADISGRYVINDFEDVAFAIEGADYWSAETGLGYQRVLFNIVVLDLGVGFNYGNINGGETGGNELIETFTNKHGANLSGRTGTNAAFSLQLGLGVLLF